MDLIIKNIEQLKYFQDKMNPKTITIDVEKMIEGHEDFYDIFKKSCKVYKHEEPTLKEATERMQGEFDATGKDVAYFMNHRTKPNVIKESDPLFVSEKLPNL